MAAFLKKTSSRLAGLIWYVLERQRHHPSLTLLALLGVILAVGLVTSATFFGDGVERAILSEKLAEFSRMTGRPPFSTSVYVFPSTRSPLALAEAETLAGHIAGALAAEVGLPLKHVGVEVESGAMMLQPGDGTDLYGEGGSYLESVNLVYIAGAGEHIDIIAGEGMDGGAADGVLDVWMHVRLAEPMGLDVGETLNIGTSLGSTAIPMRVRGFWQASDVEDSFWFNNPDETLQKSLLVQRDDYVTHVEPLVPGKTRFANWHVILDEHYVTPENARGYIRGFERGLGVIDKFLPGVRLNTPPLDPLEEFVQRETTLTILLLGFNVPALCFLLYFLVLTAVVVARWQQRDTAILVSRGMSTSHVLSITLVDEVLLFVVGLPLGILFGMLLARLMANTASFLSFVSRATLPVSLRGINWPVAFAALLLALLARLIPTAQAARSSTVQQEREQARPMRAPYWYRHYLDLLLILPTVYAYRQLNQEGTLAMLVRDRPEDLFRDPLLILVPALFILTAALITLRLFPLVMRLVDALAGMLPWTTPHLALRSLSRQSHGYINPLLLIIVSLAMGVYSLSLARSLDQWLIDRMYYRVGADLAFTPTPLVASEDDPLIDGAWIPLPASFGALPGVLGATRVGDYTITLDVPGEQEFHGRFLAIDRADYPTVAWFRDDFADEPLGALMNRLALVPDGILVPQEILEQSPLQVGDKLPLYVAVNGSLGVGSSFTIAGTFNYFPTVYNEQEITVIGNLDYLSLLMGVAPPHAIWLRTAENTDGKRVFDAVTQTGVAVDPLRHADAQALIAAEKNETERIGVFGTLSVGFLAAVTMAAIGLMTYSYASLRERLYRFAVFRAIGLRRWQIVGQVVLEYMLLTATGAAAGAIIGIAASEYFVPFFRVTGEQGVPLPPLLPIVAQQDITRLVVVFAAGMIVLEVAVIARALSWRQFSLLRGRAE